MCTYRLKISHCTTLPWIANIDGIGVWTQSGNGTEGIAGFGITNTHNPYIMQRQDVLVAAYSTPSVLKTLLVGNMFGSKVKLFWPDSLFDETHPKANNNDEIRQGDWFYGRRGVVYIGVMCSKESKVETKQTKDGTLQQVRLWCFLFCSIISK
jgi:hypothetical protein